VIGALAFAAAGGADPGKGKSKKVTGKGTRITYTVTTTDNGSCGTPWATDMLQRTFQVKDNGDGTFRLTRKDRGTFVTLAGVSPGKCDTTGNHGTMVRAGVHGKIVGFLRGTISGGTFNPNATCTGPQCGFTDVFITTFFGAGAEFSCFTNSRDCKFNFNYTAPGQDLLYRHWQDKGEGAGTMLHEEFHGDIADH
jgi:hypothetical protein